MLSKTAKHPNINRYVHELVWQDVLDEYDMLYNRTLSYQTMWPEQAIKDAFDEGLRNPRYYSQKLRAEIDKIGRQKNILQYIEQLWKEKNDTQRAQLEKLLLNTFCDFLDLYAYHRMLLLRGKTYKHIIMIAWRHACR